MKTKDNRMPQLSNSQFMVVMIMLVIVVWVVGLIISNGIIKTISFNNKVLSKKQEVERTLNANLSLVDNLRVGYSELEAIGPRPRIILSALPNSYDPPALASRMEALINASGMQFNQFSLESDDFAIGALDEGLEGHGVATAGVKEHIYGITAKGTYVNAIKMLNNFDREIYPTRIVNIFIEGDQKSTSITLSIKGYYQESVSIEKVTEDLQ